MKTYGSTTGTAHQIKNFYGAVDHKARLATKVYGPVLMPDAFDTLTIRAGGIGNITGTNPVTFTEHFKSSDSSYWNRIVSGEIVPIRLEVVRSGSLIRTRYLNLIYRYAGSSSENTAHLLSSTATTDSTFKNDLTRYGFSYKSSFSNGTDVIDLTISEATKTKLIHKGFAKPDWGEATFYSGYTTAKSLQFAPGYSDPKLITSINLTTFSNFITSNNIDTTGQVEFVGASAAADRYWYFPKNGGGTVSVVASSLNSTTGISNPGYTTQHLYFVFFDKYVVDTTSPLVTKKLLSGDELDSLCMDCYPTSNPMTNIGHTIGGVYTPAGSVTKFVFGRTTGDVKDYFLSGDMELLEIDATKWQVGSVGNNFLNGCRNLESGRIVFPKHLVSLGSEFLYNCRKYAGEVKFLTPSKLKTIKSSFMYYCQAFNSTMDLPYSVTTIESYFMYHCDIFNSYIYLPSSLTSTGSYFMAYNYVFNKTITLPSSLTTIGNDFLYYCYSFNQPLTIPSTVTSIGTYFLGYMGNMVSTITCNAPATVASTSNYTFCARGNSYASYTTGITLSGTYASDWHSRFPDRTSSAPYRKTIVA